MALFDVRRKSAEGKPPFEIGEIGSGRTADRGAGVVQRVESRGDASCCLDYLIARMLELHIAVSALHITKTNDSASSPKGRVNHTRSLP